MSLRFSVLGLLAIEPMSGYDLKKVIDESVGHFWSADQSQVYRTLATLLQDGLVTRRTVVQEDRPNMHVHEVTEAGLAEFDAWLASPLEVPQSREPFLVRLFFADRLPLDDLVGLLAARRQVVHDGLLTLEAVGAAVEAEEPAPDADGLGPTLRLATLSYGLAHAHAELAWLDTTTEQIRHAAPAD